MYSKVLVHSWRLWISSRNSVLLLDCQFGPRLFFVFLPDTWSQINVSVSCFILPLVSSFVFYFSWFSVISMLFSFNSLDIFIVYLCIAPLTSLFFFFYYNSFAESTKESQCSFEERSCLLWWYCDFAFPWSLWTCGSQNNCYMWVWGELSFFWSSFMVLYIEGVLISQLLVDP